MGTFYTDVIQKDPRFHSTNVCADLALLEPGFRARITAFIALAKSLGHDVEILETYRSPARQQELYEKHLTELRQVGVHGFGLAADLKVLVNGVYDPKGQDYLYFKDLALKDDVISGINWGEPCEHHSFEDFDHLQGVPIFRQDALFAGTWYPLNPYDPWADEKAHGVKLA